MKWNNNKGFNECLKGAVDTYLEYLSQSDKSLEQIDSDESYFLELVKNEEYLEEWITAADFNYKTIHSYQYDDVNDPKLLEGAIVVVKENGESLVMDGNHRINTLKEKSPNTLVYVIIFEI